MSWLVKNSKNRKALFIAAAIVLFSGIAALSYPMVSSNHSDNLAKSTPAATAATGSCEDNTSSSKSKMGYPNPSDKYCTQMGYQLVFREDEVGQYSECVMPDGTTCEAWQFFEGRCGEAFSYCAVMGYDIITKPGGRYSPYSAVCMDNGREVGTVVSLLHLDNLGKAIPVSRLADVLPKASPAARSTAVPAALPAAFSWRDYNGQDWMTSVKNQSGCGSCWAFSAVGATEAAYNIDQNNSNLDLNLSEEYLNSNCATINPDPGSCCGGWHDMALSVIRDEGIPDEACLPYDEAVYQTNCNCFPDGVCKAPCAGSPTQCSNLLCTDACADMDDRRVMIDQWYNVLPNVADIKQALVDHGPLAACFAASGSYVDDIFTCEKCWDKNYDSSCLTAGVCNTGTKKCTSGLTNQDCKSDWDCREDKNSDGVCNEDDCGVDHCIVISGYDDALGAWEIKNSWGGDGYFDLAYDECHIKDSVLYIEPSDIDFPSTECLQASGNIVLSDRAKVNVDVTLGGALTLGNDGKIDGNAKGMGNAVMRDRSVVTGDVTVGGTLTLGYNAAVYGTISEHAAVSYIPPTVAPVTYGTQNITVNYDQRRTLAPGNYRNLIVRDRGTLILSEGTYRFRSIQLGYDSKMVSSADGNIVDIYVADSIVINDRTKVAANESASVWNFYTPTTTSITIGYSTQLNADLTAPNAALTVRGQTAVNGCLAGSAVTVDPDAVISD